MNVYDLAAQQQSLVLAMYDAAKEHFPEIDTALEVWYNPDNKEHILLNVDVPFFDNDREQEFSSFTAGLLCETHEQSGVHISLIPRYVPEMEELAV